MKRTLTTLLKSIDLSHTYSAKDAFPIAKSVMADLKKESDFRDFIRRDVADKNVLNAKIYKKGRQSRFVIRGEDLARGLKVLAS